MSAINTIPWWALSPSPYTLVYWILISLYGAWRLNARTPKQWLKYSVIGGMIFFLCILLPVDMAWQGLQWMRFGNLYPDEVFLVIAVYTRNIGGMYLCIFFINMYGKAEKLNVWRRIDFWSILYLFTVACFMVVWFMLASGPEWTDWTYGIRYGFSWETIWRSFIISHILLKALMGWVYVELFM